jgi:monoterpene epsilon-lactone hydrolase
VVTPHLLPIGWAKRDHQHPGTGGPARLGYLKVANMKDPLISPVDLPEVLAKFPRTLIVTGTRAFEMAAHVSTERLSKRALVG